MWHDQRTRQPLRSTANLLGALALLMCFSHTAKAEPASYPVQAITASAEKSAEAEGHASSKLRYVLDAVRLRGNNKTRDAVLLRFIPFAPGDVLDVDDPRLLLTQYRLLGTELFREVTLSLSRGHERGHVILNVEVIERNTLVINSIWLGLAASADTSGQRQSTSTFAGLDGAENNLLGTGISLGPAVTFSDDQFAGNLHLRNPSFLGSNWMLSAEARYAAGLGFFGNSDVRWDAPDQTETARRQAVVNFRRIGGSVNAGIELDQALRLWIGYRFDGISSRLPLAASHRYAGQTEPIDFHIAAGTSYVSALKGTLALDTRDRPFLTKTGWTAAVSAEAALQPLGSTYSYQKLDLSAARWWPLDGKAGVQTLMLSATAGAIAGRAPFFEQYYIGDLSDLIPSRILGLAFDDRPAPNLLGTSIADVRYGDYAGSVNLEYSLHLFRGAHSIYGVDAFVRAGLIGLGSARNFQRPATNRQGLALIPVDVNANLGLRFDTSLGGVTLSLSNTLGFLLSRSRRE